MRTILPVYFVSAVVIAGSSLFAQPGAAKAAPATSVVSADDVWASLKDLAKPRALPAPAAHTPAAVNAARQQAVTGLVADADRLQDFYVKNPTHAEAKEAKRLEALLLVEAWQAGDTAHDTRRNQLVAEVRQDAAIAPAERAEVAALADHVAVAKRANLSPAEKLGAYEQTVRNLTAEFPTLPNGYESLVQIARFSPPARAQAIARDVVAMPAAPKEFKQRAQGLLDRYALVGHPLAPLFAPIYRVNNPLAQAAGHPVIVYTWATFSPGSIALARDVAGKAPKGAVVIGLCLDIRDLAPARARAAVEKLPGEQIYDWLGRRGEVAEALKLDAPGLVLTADAQGAIVSVAAQQDLAALSSL